MRVGAFGEVMMRLTPKDNLLMEQTHDMRVDFTGTGVNVLAALAHLDVQTELLTALPQNRVGQAARAELRHLGVGTSNVVFRGDHIGTYIAEQGWGARPTRVTYLNRSASAFCQCPLSAYEIDAFLDRVDGLHVCGISLSLTNEVWETALCLAQHARKKGKRVFFDCNYRASLNAGSEAEARYLARARAILPFCDVVFATAWDAGRIVEQGPGDGPEDALGALVERYGISALAFTSRVNDGTAVCGHVMTSEAGSFSEVCSKAYSTPVLDRIGAGDAFAAGVILGLAERWAASAVAEFAAASYVLACTIRGDAPRVGREDVERLVRGERSEIIR